MAKPPPDPSQRLKNDQHEHFARLRSIGTDVLTAYEQAGYSPDRKNAKKLDARPDIEARVRALMAPTMAKLDVTRERWLQEVSAIAFSDIRDAIQWTTHTDEEVDNPDGGEILVIKHIHSHRGTFTNSSDLTPMQAAAIQSAKIKPDGEIELKMHSKVPALRMMGEALRVLGRHQRASEDDPNLPAAGERSPAQITDELRALFNKSLEEHEERSAHARLIEGTATEE